MPKRIESPSSINTFKQCKRKYYYQYLAKLPTLPNIHQVRGNIAHSTLESFYDINVTDFTLENYPLKFQEAVQKLFLYHWNVAQPELKKLAFNSDQEMFYFEETMLMLMNWVNQFIEKIDGVMKEKKISLPEAFFQLVPLREQEFTSQKLSVHGFIDAIHTFGDEVHIIDYKTNAEFEIKESIKLQLGVYSLLYHEKHGILPTKVGIFFLRHKLKLMNVDEELLNSALKEIGAVHAHTSNHAHVDGFPTTPSRLCKWGTGQCDFYETCKPFGGNNSNGRDGEKN